MGCYLRKNMHSGENILFEAQLHWIVYHTGLVFTIIGALLGHFGLEISHKFLSKEISAYVDKPLSYLGVAVIALGALYLVVAFIRQISTELVITDQRVIAKHGLVSVTTFELMLPKVEGANIDQSIAGRVLGYGTVMVKGTGGGISPIDHVAQPHKFHAALMRALDASHERQPYEDAPRRRPSAPPKPQREPKGDSRALASVDEPFEGGGPGRT